MESMVQMVGLNLAALFFEGLGEVLDQFLFPLSCHSLYNFVDFGLVNCLLVEKSHVC